MTFTEAIKDIDTNFNGFLEYVYEDDDVAAILRDDRGVLVIDFGVGYWKIEITREGEATINRKDTIVPFLKIVSFFEQRGIQFETL